MTIATVLFGFISVIGVLVWYFIHMIKRNERLEVERKVKEHRDEVNKAARERRKKIKDLVAGRKSATRSKLRKRSKSRRVSKARVPTKKSK